MGTDAQDLFVEIDQLELCYRDEGDPSHEPVLMIMGLTSQLIHWPQEIVDKLVAAGYRVIRFDNRDSGLTTWLGDPPESYRLADMANDAKQLLDHLEIDKAHVVGASMGGMIAQRYALDHLDYVQTLCSIMSTTGRMTVGGPEPGVIQQLTQPLPPNLDEAIAQIVAAYERIGSKKYAQQELPIRQAVAKAAYERGTDAEGNQRHPDGAARQVNAITNGGDRTEALKGLSVPTLVIHGDEDSLIHISGGRATRNAIPDAQWLTYPDYPAYDGVHGMGHDLPKPLHDAIVSAIAANLAREPVTA
jgi:pimeloyl-ACP methyl ester carboxylesterase